RTVPARNGGNAAWAASVALSAAAFQAFAVGFDGLGPLTPLGLGLLGTVGVGPSLLHGDAIQILALGVQIRDFSGGRRGQTGVGAVPGGVGSWLRPRGRVLIPPPGVRLGSIRRGVLGGGVR